MTPTPIDRARAAIRALHAALELLDEALTDLSDENDLDEEVDPQTEDGEAVEVASTRSAFAAVCDGDLVLTRRWGQKEAPAD